MKDLTPYLLRRTRPVNGKMAGGGQSDGVGDFTRPEQPVAKGAERSPGARNPRPARREAAAARLADPRSGLRPAPVDPTGNESRRWRKGEIPGGKASKNGLFRWAVMVAPCSILPNVDFRTSP